MKIAVVDACGKVDRALWDMLKVRTGVKFLMRRALDALEPWRPPAIC